MTRKITIEFPFKYHKPASAKQLVGLVWWKRYTCWLVSWAGGSIQEFGGSRVNSRRHLSILGWKILQYDRNQYHDRTAEERADAYLNSWAACDKELRGLRLLQMGDEYPDPELRELLKRSLGIDLDEGRII